MDEIIIYYSAAKREQVVRAAKGFARAVGTPEDDLRKVGREDSQDFSWTDAPKRFLTGFNVEFSHRGPIWKVYFNFSRYVL